MLCVYTPLSSRGLPLYLREVPCRVNNLEVMKSQKMKYYRLQQQHEREIGNLSMPDGLPQPITPPLEADHISSP